MGNYKELLVWQKSVHFVTEIYTCIKNFQKKKFMLLPIRSDALQF